MTSGGGMFSPEEIRYLKSLPAVAEVTAKRITYTDEFKRYCIRRYNEGASPVRLFRDAGLDPALIGYKRIERCIARWRAAQSRNMRADLAVLAKTPAGGVSKAASPHEIQESAELPESPSPVDTADESGFHIAPERRAIVVPSSGQAEHDTDLRDLLIAQQVRLVDSLERKVDMLEAMLHAQRRDGQSDDESDDERHGGAARTRGTT
ncbi:hypothetical protein [Bifidobacterium reuteri]|nr:hypothetical protein [Bifidobacterium reuteri]